MPSAPLTVKKPWKFLFSYKTSETIHNVECFFSSRTLLFENLIKMQQENFKGKNDGGF